MTVRITPLYLGTIMIMVMILASSFLTIGTWMEWWGEWDVYQVVWTFIVNWVIVITFAILGGILFGMFVGFRLLSSQGFTPFEKEMLRMMKTIDDIQERVTGIEERMDTMGQSSPGGTDGKNAGNSGEMVGPGPGPGIPDDAGPGIAGDPVGSPGAVDQGRREHPGDP